MKIFLIIPMALFEVLLLIISVILARVHTKTAKKLVLWSIKTLPNKEWYK